MFDVAKHNVCSIKVEYLQGCKKDPRTNLLRTHGGLISQAALMNFNFPRKTFAIKCRSDEDLGKFDWSSALDFNERPLIKNVSHFFLMLFPLINLLFQIGYLFGDSIKPMTIARPISDRTNKGSIRIFKRLLDRFRVRLEFASNGLTVSSFLPAS
jgi:hypothetical protein